jgi:hypothetical protein
VSVDTITNGLPADSTTATITLSCIILGLGEATGTAEVKL